MTDMHAPAPAYPTEIQFTDNYDFQAGKPVEGWLREKKYLEQGDRFIHVNNYTRGVNILCTASDEDVEISQHDSRPDNMYFVFTAD